MTSDDHPVAGTEPSPTAANRIGLYSAILTAVMTVVTFGLAIIVIPNSGAGGREDCVEYPYLDTLSEFPRDYLWMPPAMMLVVVYVVLVVSIHAHTSHRRRYTVRSGCPSPLSRRGCSLVTTSSSSPSSP